MDKNLSNIERSTKAFNKLQFHKSFCIEQRVYKFETFYDLYASKALGYINYYLNDIQVSEKILVEVFIQAWKQFNITANYSEKHFIYTLLIVSKPFINSRKLTSWLKNYSSIGIWLVIVNEIIFKENEDFNYNKEKVFVALFLLQLKKVVTIKN